MTKLSVTDLPLGSAVESKKKNRRSACPIRVLMVIAPVLGTNEPPIWAKRQIESIERLGVKCAVYVFHNRRSILGLLHGGRALRRKIHEYQPDLVHVHYGAAQGLVAVLFSNRPVVLSFCGSDLLGNYGPSGYKTWSGRLSRWLSQLGAVGCRRCIAKSEGLKSSLWISSARNRCMVIPNGIDLDMFRPMPQEQARAMLGWTHQDPVVLFMDRKGAWVKDPNLAWTTYSEAKKVVGSVRLYVLESEPPEKMPLFLNAADALLLTSRHEGSNNTLKEALACNLPIVTTDCGDTSERLAGVSFSYVCSRDPRELAPKLLDVMRLRQRSNGRQRVLHLSLDHVAKQIKQYYEEALTPVISPESAEVHSSTFQ